MFRLSSSLVSHNRAHKCSIMMTLFPPNIFPWDIRRQYPLRLSLSRRMQFMLFMGDRAPGIQRLLLNRTTLQIASSPNNFVALGGGELLVRDCQVAMGAGSAGQSTDSICAETGYSTYKMPSTAFYVSDSMIAAGIARSPSRSFPVQIVSTRMVFEPAWSTA